MERSCILLKFANQEFTEIQRTHNVGTEESPIFEKETGLYVKRILSTAFYRERKTESRNASLLARIGIYPLLPFLDRMTLFRRALSFNSFSRFSSSCLAWSGFWKGKKVSTWNEALSQGPYIIRVIVPLTLPSFKFCLTFDL